MYTLVCFVRDPLSGQETAVQHSLDENAPLSAAQMDRLQTELQVAMDGLKAVSVAPPML